VGAPQGQAVARPAGRGRPDHPGVERRLGVGSGGLQPGHPAGRDARCRPVPAAGQDLRHGRRRGGPGPCPHGRVRRAGDDRAHAHPDRGVLHPGGGPVRLPQGPAPVGDLRPQRSRAGRADLPRRPAGVPQHADVLQRRDAEPDPGSAALRTQSRGAAVPGQGGDAPLAQSAVRPGGPGSPILPPPRDPSLDRPADSPAFRTGRPGCGRGRAVPVAPRGDAGGSDGAADPGRRRATGHGEPAGRTSARRGHPGRSPTSSTCR
jgi:hypothetical protein